MEQTVRFELDFLENKAKLLTEDMMKLSRDCGAFQDRVFKLEGTIKDMLRHIPASVIRKHIPRTVLADNVPEDILQQLYDGTLDTDSDLISAAGQDLRDETRSFAQETQSLERNMTELATSSDYFQDRISTLKRTFEEIVGRIPAKVVKKYIPADILKAKVPDSTLQQLDDGTFEEESDSRPSSTTMEKDYLFHLSMEEQS